MKELFFDIRLIILESMSVFTKSPLTGRVSFSLIDSASYFMMPILLIILFFYIDVPIKEDQCKAIIGILSIFVVLAFQVVYIATDKFTARVRSVTEARNAENGICLFEDEKNYLKRLGNYTRQFVRQLVLLLLISLFIILFSTLGLCIKYHLVQVCLSALIVSGFYIWLLLLLKMIVSIYKLQMDDIEQNYKILRQ